MAKLQCYLFIMIFCFGTLKALKNTKQPNGTTLRLVNVIFRHGDRTLEFKAGEGYPNDPYKNYNYPNSDGQLTIIGKRRAFQLGRVLKIRYNRFLGNIYYPPNVYARSTQMSRCKMSLQLVLAALYPPASSQKWNLELNWQPTDFIYAPLFNDGLLLPIICNSYQQLYHKVLQTPAVIAKIKKFDDLMKKMSLYTGNNITDIYGLMLLYTTLSIESNLGLSLPDWTRDVFPSGPLLDAAITQFKLFSYNDELIRRNGGTLLYRMINDMKGVINKTLKKLKINLFSGHDQTIAAMLIALGVYDYSLPKYTSAVILELHEMNNQHFVKVLHYLGTPWEIVEVSIPNCDVLCPYNDFVRLRSSVIPTEEDPTCPITIPQRFC